MCIIHIPWLHGCVAGQERGRGETRPLIDRPTFLRSLLRRRHYVCRAGIRGMTWRGWGGMVGGVRREARLSSVCMFVRQQHQPGAIYRLFVRVCLVCVRRDLPLPLPSLSLCVCVCVSPCDRTLFGQLNVIISSTYACLFGCLGVWVCVGVRKGCARPSVWVVYCLHVCMFEDSRAGVCG